MSDLASQVLLYSAELASLAGLSRVTVTYAVNGHPVLPSTLRKLANALTATPPLRGAAEITG